ncbi:DUF4395 domain-containing protein [Amaricoccus macauensis]|uniref:DUF4395 domain-containing protein n=1 Tax=Amaricoccus macauensis TaxID=57001 RepID=UPI003C7B10AB
MDGSILQTLHREPGTKRPFYGQRLDPSAQHGARFKAGVFNENEVRAAAGIMMAIGGIGLAHAYFDRNFLPIQIVVAVFFAEFLIRITLGLHRSPFGRIARLMTRRISPHWVSARPKRFAWSIGLVMSSAMLIVALSGNLGPPTLLICLLCLALMWLEAVLGICVGCEIHRLIVRRGWAEPDPEFEVCTHGDCAISAPRPGEAP